MRVKGKRASMRLGKKEIYGKISELFNTIPTNHIRLAKYSRNSASRLTRSE